ncbi:hypothetical protein DAPPUDRAFT_113021 [Daphnia pulex]|uniref:Uncharacterized protein n=1 Tax=Daphnia pulex TaxID=6669 RepID=E9HDU2_DAPPU|nr:hypothetical protein DAPPUDRAFT_113021 [Daphnia pulex]|eukprot:EFX70084.1 hypothetical protein DAPPUDRAFT_113021 [Daphnia pulex]
MAAVVSQGWSGGSGGGGQNPGGSGGGADEPTHWRCPYFNRPNMHGRISPTAAVAATAAAATNHSAATASIHSPAATTTHSTANYPANIPPIIRDDAAHFVEASLSSINSPMEWHNITPPAPRCENCSCLCPFSQGGN